MQTVSPVSHPRSSRPVLRRAALFAGAAALSFGLVAGLGGAVFSVPAPAIAQASRAFAGPPSFADVVEQVKPAVVSVRVRARAEMADGPREARPFGEGAPRGRRGEGAQLSQGSGFFISADGFVVTNHHVVQNASEVQLITDEGRTLNARVVGTDSRTDLALLRVTDGGTFPFVRLSAANPRIGDWVIAVGNPFGLGGTVTAGIVSARNRDIGSGPYDDYLQIDAAVNRGNSGGPTFNAAGEVVGVNTAIVSPSGGNVGIAFAIPANVVEAVVADLRAKGSVSRGFLGVQIQPVTPEIADAIGLANVGGALVAAAEPGSPAARAGIQRGDTIIAVEGERIRDARELTRRIAAVRPGERVRLTIWREGRERSLQIEVGRQPAA